jgi:peptidoglycan/xylan/chitin deacetylase (PgdA/CDA1 family)
MMGELKVPVLCYHRIADLADADPLRPFSVTPWAFARQIAWLAARGYRTMDLAGAVAAPGAADSRCVILTFDDGYLEHYELVFPLLARYGFRATFFLVSGWLGQGDRSPHPPVSLLSPSCILEMSRSGMVFGAHSRTHRRLAGLAPPEAWDEVAGSKEDLERVLGLSVSAFAYPFGVLDRGVRQVVAACGYEVAVAVNNGTDDPLAMRRIVLGAGDSLLTFVWKVWDRPVRLRRRASLWWRSFRGGRDDA